MLRKIVGTTNDPTLTVLRVVLGIVFFAHGAQKVLGWFGGFGFSGTMGHFTHQLGIPAPLAFLAIVTEFLGGLGLIIGLLSRVAALGIGIEMTIVIFMIHARFGFFMNWAGQQKGEGYEYHLLVIAVCMAILIRGSGALSVDRLIAASAPPQGRLATA
jgi:putative oxidoreductase